MGDLVYKIISHVNTVMEWEWHNAICYTCPENGNVAENIVETYSTATTKK